MGVSPKAERQLAWIALALNVLLTLLIVIAILHHLDSVRSYVTVDGVPEFSGHCSSSGDGLHHGIDTIDNARPVERIRKLLSADEVDANVFRDQLQAWSQLQSTRGKELVYALPRRKAVDPKWPRKLRVGLVSEVFGRSFRLLFSGFQLSKDRDLQVRS